MRKPALIISVACLALAACGDSAKEEKTPQSQDEIAKEAGQLTKPQPGQYVSKSEVINFEVPGLPPEQADQMKQMFTGMGAQEQSYCMTKEQAEKGFEDAIREMGQGEEGMNCKFDRFNVNGNALDAQLACDAGDKGSAKMTMTGTVTETSQDVEMHISQENAQIPGGKMTIGMKVSSKRTGDCKEGSS
ncbi:MAG: DUF3617 domain-containing protein [Sphingomonadaceae bacterium]